ncbi:hypothetical protein [Bradyrhizobium lupini]|uniref:hypothetical protein n=1 Tax=Rhizobium lupini TaxID=136996 RepID=UPI0034C6ACAA
MNSPLPPKDVGCHRTGFAKGCRECVVEHNCQLWMHISGANPNTGEALQTYGCADTFMPLLMIENSQQQRQTGAAVESLRNEMVNANERLIAAPRDMKLING